MATSTTLRPPKEASAVKDDRKKGGKGEKEAKSGGSKKKLVIIALVVLLAAGAGVKFFVLGGSSAPEKPQPGAVLKLDSINVNLADSHYLKFGIALQTTTKASSEIDGSRALDIAISELSGQKMQDLAVPAKREKAKADLVKEVADAYEGEVMDVYFTEFVMQ